MQRRDPWMFLDENRYEGSCMEIWPRPMMSRDTAPQVPQSSLRSTALEHLRMFTSSLVHFSEQKGYDLNDDTAFNSKRVVC